MAINITGAEFLDDNNYKGIIINENNKEYEIIVNGPYNNKTFDLEKKFYSTLNDKTDIEKIIEIIKLYLKENKITELNDNRRVKCLSGEYLLAGDGNKYLSILTKKFKYGAIYDTIINKFYYDRDEFFKQNKDINRIEINMKGYSTYKVKKDVYGDYLELNLFSTEGVLTIEDEMFLTKLIYNKLKESNHPVELENKNLYSEEIEAYYNLGYDLTCGNIYMSINNADLLPTVTKAVVMYEKQKENLENKKVKKENN